MAKENCIKRKIRFIETFGSISKKRPSSALSVIFPASGKNALYRIYIVWTQLQRNEFVEEINFQFKAGGTIFYTLETKRNYFRIEKGRKYKRKELNEKWKKRQAGVIERIEKGLPAETFDEVLASVK